MNAQTYMDHGVELPRGWFLEEAKYHPYSPGSSAGEVEQLPHYTVSAAGETDIDQPRQYVFGMGETEDEAYADAARQIWERQTQYEERQHIRHPALRDARRLMDTKGPGDAAANRQVLECLYAYLLDQGASHDSHEDPVAPADGPGPG